MSLFVFDTTVVSRGQTYESHRKFLIDAPTSRKAHQSAVKHALRVFHGRFNWADAVSVTANVVVHFDEVLR